MVAAEVTDDAVGIGIREGRHHPAPGDAGHGSAGLPRGAQGGIGHRGRGVPGQNQRRIFPPGLPQH